jgi:hypothetical protein
VLQVHACPSGREGGGKSLKRVIVLHTVRHICWLGVGKDRHAACLPPLTEHVFPAASQSHSSPLHHNISPPPSPLQHCLVVAALNVHPKNSPAPGRQKGSVALALRLTVGRAWCRFRQPSIRCLLCLRVKSRQFHATGKTSENKTVSLSLYDIKL